MITVTLISPDFTGAIDERDAPLGEIVADIRRTWNEGDGPQLFLLSDGHAYVATMLRGDDDEECITTYSDGTVERHRCHYHLDEHGRFARCEVTELALARA